MSLKMVTSVRLALALITTIMLGQALAQDERSGLCGQVDTENAVEATFDALYEDRYLPIDVLNGYEIETIQVKQVFGESVRLVEVVCEVGAFIPVVTPNDFDQGALPDEFPRHWVAYAVYGMEALACESWGAAYSSSSLQFDVNGLALVFAERPPEADGFPLLLPIRGEGEISDLDAVAFGTRNRVEGALHHAIQILLLPEGSTGTMTLYDQKDFGGRSCSVGTR